LINPAFAKKYGFPFRTCKNRINQPYHYTHDNVVTLLYILN
jgi:hypothetical protein